MLRITCYVSRSTLVLAESASKMAEGSGHLVDDGVDPETEGIRIIYTDSNERIKQNHVYTHVESVGQLAENSCAILDQFNATEFTVSVLEGRMDSVRNPERILGSNTEKPHITTVPALQSLDNGRGFRKHDTATIMRNGFRGATKKLLGTNRILRGDCEATVPIGQRSVFACAGKNNQGLKQVMSKFSPAWALNFSVARDAEREPNLLVNTIAWWPCASVSILKLLANMRRVLPPLCDLKSCC